jgi:hypothetical protein
MQANPYTIFVLIFYVWVRRFSAFPLCSLEPTWLGSWAHLENIGAKSFLSIHFSACGTHCCEKFRIFILYHIFRPSKTVKKFASSNGISKNFACKLIFSSLLDSVDLIYTKNHSKITLCLAQISMYPSTHRKISTKIVYGFACISFSLSNKRF